VTLYALLVGGGAVSNVWTALLVALTIASLWYFPRLDFVNRSPTWPLAPTAARSNRSTCCASTLTRATASTG
jgi:hypothetical protein